MNSERDSLGRFVLGHEGIKGEKNCKWLGDKAGYDAIHDWVKRTLGKPSKCEHCGTEFSKKFEWASKSHSFKRDLNDWIRLCTSCHRKFDGHAYKRAKTMKALGIPFRHPIKKHCLRGHFMSEKTCRIKNGVRHCRKCSNLRNKKYLLKKKNFN